MPQYINSLNLKKIWDKDTSNRTYRTARRIFYDSKNELPHISGRLRLDGNPKTILNVSFTRLIADTISGYMLNNGISYTSFDNDDAETTKAILEFNRLSKVLNIRGLDITHVRDAVLYGSSVEVYGLNQGEITIKDTDPLSWSFIRGEDGEIVTGIYKQTIKGGNVFRGQLLDKDQDFYFVYDDESVRVYTQAENSNGMLLIEETENYFDKIPIVEFKIAKTPTSYISDSIMHQIVEHNGVLSSLVDGVKWNINSILHMKKVDMEKLLMKNADGKCVLDIIKELGIFPSKEEVDLSFVERSIDQASFEYTLKSIRSSIFEEAGIPEVASVISKLDTSGSITSISGTALALSYEPLESRATEFSSYFASGLRRRMSLINGIWSKTGLPNLDPAKINICINHRVPRSIDTELQYNPAWRDILPLKELIRQNPLVEDVEQVYKQKLMEMGEQNPSPQSQINNTESQN